MDPNVRVFVVQHLHVIHDDQEDVKFIGVYSSRDTAEEAVQRLRAKPGFCDAPEGFSIDPYNLNEDNWTDGYVTIHHSDEASSDLGSEGRPKG
jgi:hypothetical protein